MPRETTTVRISVAARERLTRVAESRGASVASVLEEMVGELGEQMLLEGAQRAWTEMAGDPGWRAEARAWEATLGDGVAG